MQINPYLLFHDGQCEEAMQFYADTLGGKIATMMRMGEMPGAEDFVPADRREMVAHVQLDLDNGSSLMASDGMGNEENKGYEGVTLQLACDSPEAAKTTFDGLADGGQVEMPLDKTFWARAFGICRDRYGVRWMINCD